MSTEHNTKPIALPVAPCMITWYNSYINTFYCEIRVQSSLPVLPRALALNDERLRLVRGASSPSRNPSEITVNTECLAACTALSDRGDLRGVHWGVEGIAMQSAKDVLVIGGGISGMQAALDLAEKGFQVVLVDREASIGGVMVKLDKTFPTNDCSICIAAPKMVEVARHPNIELLTYASVEQVLGSEGNFHVSIWRQTNYVDAAICTGCGDCETVCPIEVSHRFDERLSKRKAIYLQFPQAVPSVYTIDYRHCIGCGACERVCQAGAISFLKKSQEISITVGSIIVATGFTMLEPLEIRKEYGYGKYPNVITALQYERLLSASGPTAGNILRPSDGKKPARIAWIQCVGSRSKHHGFAYCSRICCMYATKEAIVTVENNPGIATTIFYMDVRAYGKDFQQYYQRARTMGIQYIRSRPSHVYENPDRSLTIVYEDTTSNRVEEATVDLLVLSTAVLPAPGNRKLARVLGIGIDEHGFFQQPDLLLEPTRSTRAGIFLAGCAQGPKDIPDSVAQASAAAAKAVIPIRDRPRTPRGARSSPPPVSTAPQHDERPRIGVFVCNCGKNIAGYLDVDAVTHHARSIPQVVFTELDVFACSEDTQRRMKEAIRAHQLNRIVVAACSPITHGALFQQTCEEAGLNRYLFEMANIRNQCSWVHSNNHDLATRKAIDLVDMAIAKAAHLRPLNTQIVEVNPNCLVIGGGVAGMKAALGLADMGVPVYLVEREAALGGTLRQLHTLFPTDRPAEEVLRPLLQAVEQHRHITVLLNTEIADIDGYIGNFTITVTSRVTGIEQRFTTGTIIVATGFHEIDLTGSYGYGSHPHIITQLELEGRLKSDTLGAPRTVVMINCAGAMDEVHPYCCRIGCGVAIKNAKLIKQRVPSARLFLLYQDMRLFGKYEEEYYADVLERVHPVMIRYTREHPPVVTIRDGVIYTTVFDTALNQHVEIETDLLVLTAQTQGDMHASKLKRMLKVSTTAGNFYSEAHAKIRPLDFATDGVYVCGSAHFPKNLPDAIAQAEGAASRAAIPLLVGQVQTEPTIAEINQELCVGCGLCVTVCPYGAIVLNSEQRVARINEVLCKGCGACSAACPSGASQQRYFTDTQILSMLQSAWRAK